MVSLLVNFYPTKLYRRDVGPFLSLCLMPSNAHLILTASEGEIFINVHMLAVKYEGLKNMIALTCRKGGCGSCIAGLVS